MIRKLIYIILFLFILADTGYSFLQHLSQSLDGDMSETIVPKNSIKPILDCPSGIDVILKKQAYHNPNRFFSHWTYNKYFNSIPLLLQKFVEPIDSVYLSCAILKIIVQVVLIILLSMIISGTLNVLKMDFIIAAVLITPLFQTNGYQNYMGIIDPSITYTFFYALPSALLILYFLPFIFRFYHKKLPLLKISIAILWIPLAIMVCLSGPLNPAIILIFSMLVFLKKITANYIHSNLKGTVKRAANAFKIIPRSYWLYLLPICILSLYSIFIGTYNISTIAYQISIGELYSRLPEGIYYQFTQKLGFPILFIILTINTLIIHYKYRNNEGNRILITLKWVGIFALIYILLLPLGGYRDYRFNVLRYDTIMPITLSLILFFGISTLFLLKTMSNKQKTWYIPIIVAVLFIFTYSDKAMFNKNNCERIALKEISMSKEKIVQLKDDCKVLSWDLIIKPEDSDLNAQLLYIWRITKEKKLYYNK